MKFHFDGAEIGITHKDTKSVLTEAHRRLKSGQGFALATLNLDHLVKLRGNRVFQAAYAAQDLVVADGNPIVWLSGLSGEPVSLAPGADLVLPLVHVAADLGLPVAMIGSTRASLDGAADYLRRTVANVQIGPCIPPEFGFDPTGEEARRILAEIARIGPCVCLLALGAPKQEQLAALGRELAPQAGFASIGAGVDFLAGHQHRAPAWMRSIAMEWAWRLMQSPRRMLPRYAGCVAIMPQHILQAISQRRAG